MKTKIVYISGNEIFDMNDIRAAFEEVRNALNLDKTTVLFGVPVDADDAGFAAESDTETTNVLETIPGSGITEESEDIYEPQPVEIPVSEANKQIELESKNESAAEQHSKKRGLPRKEDIVEETTVENISETEKDSEPEEKIVPILSVLSSEENQETITEVIDKNTNNQMTTIEIIPEESDENFEKTSAEINEDSEFPDDDEADLEKLLSAMTPLQEDVPEKPLHNEIEEEKKSDYDFSIDATLEQLATEFAENQDKIVSETKSTTRSKIGKLRNILPFKQSKHKDQGLGDLFGWAGVAANDEDFSVPGFFTSAASKK